MRRCTAPHDMCSSMVSRINCRYPARVHVTINFSRVVQIIKKKRQAKPGYSASVLQQGPDYESMKHTNPSLLYVQY